MLRSDIDRKIREALTLVLARPVADSGDITRESEPAWDSLKHVELIFVVEAEFQVAFEETEMAEICSLSDLVTAVERRLGS